MVHFPRALYLSVSAAAVFCLLATSADAQSTEIKIVIQEGQGAINNIKEHRAKEPVVQVLHQDGEAVLGATVTFLLPDTGPGGAFNDGAHVLTVQTDSKGQAVGRGLRPNQAPGRFQIRVTASYHGQTASAAIAQINAEPAATGGGGKKFLIIALIGGAAAGGLAAALGHKSGSSSSPSSVSNTPGTVLIPGTPSIQPPH